MAEPAVELIDASKSYGRVEALRAVSLRVDAGEVVAILGPNGAGKTTAISLMLGIRRPTAGAVRLFGLPPGDRAARSRCGVMLQESGVNAALKVGELVDLFRTYYPRPMPAGRALAAAGLAEQAGTAAGKLSGGQRQRLYFALAVAGDPDLMFLDEPTVGMDVESRRAFLDGIREFAAEGKTIVLTTHYLEEADELAHRVVVIDRGSVIADASPREIKARVAGKRVEFLAPGVERGQFDGLPWSSLEIDGERVRILSANPEALLSGLFARGVQLAELTVTGADLEEAFLSLTRKPEAEVPA